MELHLDGICGAKIWRFGKVAADAAPRRLFFVPFDVQSSMFDVQLAAGAVMVRMRIQTFKAAARG
ncbi:MAG: hypothetical protein ABIZ56_00315 [Chthoniobacteraceae bacterium]